MSNDEEQPVRPKCQECQLPILEFEDKMYITPQKAEELEVVEGPYCEDCFDDLVPDTD